MSGKIKFTAILVIALLFLLLSAGWVVLSQRNIQTWISDYVLRSTDRELNIDGELKIAWSFPPKVYAHGVRIANDEWGQYPELFTADRISVSFSFFSLLQGDIRVDQVEIESPRLWIEQNAESGKFNVDWRKPNKSTYSENKFPQSLQLTGFAVHNGQINLRQGDYEWEARIDDARLKSPEFRRPTNIQINGELQDTPLSLTGYIGSIESLSQYQESTVNLDGYIGIAENHISITGVVSDLLRWRGLNLWFESYIKNLSTLSSLAGITLPQFKDVVASWEIVQPETIDTMRMESLQAQTNDSGLDVRAEGGIGQLTRLDEVDIALIAKGALDNSLLMPWLAKEAHLVADVVAHVSGGKESLTLNLDRGVITADGVMLNINGRIDDLLGDWRMPLDLSLKGKNLASFGRLFDKDWPETSAVEASADLYRTGSKFDLTDIIVSTKSSQLDFTGGGYIQSLGDKNSGRMDFKLTASKSYLTKFMDNQFIAMLDRVSADGEVIINKDRYAVSDLSVKGYGEGLSVSGAGKIKSLFPLQELVLALDAKVDGLDSLNGLVDRKFPSTEPIRFSAILKQGAENVFGLDKISGSLNDPSLSVDIIGNIDNIGKSQTTNLEFDFNINNAELIPAAFPDFASPELITPLLPLHGSAQFKGQPDSAGKSSYALKALKIDTRPDQLVGQFRGDINKLFTDAYLGRLSMQFSGNLDERFVPSGLIPDLFIAPLTGELKAAASITLTPESTALNDIDLRLDSEKATIQAKGHIARFSPMVLEDIQLIIETADIAEVVKLDYLPLKSGIPASSKFDFKDTEGKREIELKMQVGTSDISGIIALETSKAEQGKQGDTMMKADFYSNTLDLPRLLVESEDSDKFFSDSVLETDWLQGIDFQMDAEFKRFTNSVFTLSNLKSSTLVRNGQLETHFYGESQQGPLEMDVTMAARDYGLDAQIAMTGRNVDLNVFTSAAKSDANENGAFSVDLNLSGQGDSIAKIMANADGLVSYELGGAKIRSKGLQLLSQDLFFGLLNAINPLTEEDDFVNIECNFVRLEVEDGVAKAEQGFALKTGEFTLLGGGQVDFASENIDFVMTTKARKGLGINTNTIAKLIGVGGTINNPEFKPSTQGMLQTGFAIGAAIASGGVSLIAQGFFDRIKANSDVCNPSPEKKVKIEVKAKDEK